MNIKILRILPRGAASPKPFFSYQAQIFSWPEKKQDFSHIADWMGIVPYGGWADQEISYPGALSFEKLQKRLCDSEKALAEEKEVYR